MKFLSVLFFLVTLTVGSQTVVSNDTLRIGVYESPPFVIYDANGDVEGVSGWLWSKLKNDLNRPYKLITYDTEQPLSDLLNDLKEETIDFSINPVTITSTRDRDMTFTYPFFIGDLGIAKREEHIIESIETTVTSIFNKRILSLMLVLVVMVIIFGSLIWLIEKRNNHFERGFQGFLSSLWWSAVIMTTVGYGDKVPITNSGRLIAFIWMLCSIMTIAIFTASITSALTVRQLNNSDYSLSNYKQNQVGRNSNSASEEFLKRNFFRNIERYPEFKMGLNALTDTEIELFIYDRPWLVYQIQNNPDYKDLELLPMRFNMQSYAMPMRKNIDLDFKHKISSALIELLETKDWQLLLKEYELHQD